MSVLFRCDTSVTSENSMSPAVSFSLVTCLSPILGHTHTHTHLLHLPVSRRLMSAFGLPGAVWEWCGLIICFMCHLVSICWTVSHSHRPARPVTCPRAGPSATPGNTAAVSLCMFDHRDVLLGGLFSELSLTPPHFPCFMDCELHQRADGWLLAALTCPRRACPSPPKTSPH